MKKKEKKCKKNFFLLLSSSMSCLSLSLFSLSFILYLPTNLPSPSPPPSLKLEKTLFFFQPTFSWFTRVLVYVSRRICLSIWNIARWPTIYLNWRKKGEAKVTTFSSKKKYIKTRTRKSILWWLNKNCSFLLPLRRGRRKQLTFDCYHEVSVEKINFLEVQKKRIKKSLRISWK